jgi:hypothetical protein
VPLDHSQPLDSATALRHLRHGHLGIDALAFRASAFGSRDATTSSLPLRHVGATHHGHRATAVPSGLNAANFWPEIHG